MIRPLKNGMMLYHGSYCEVTKPNLRKCNPYKDFGRGFYLTSDIEQARSFAKISALKAKKRGDIAADAQIGYVNYYGVSEVEGLEVLIYQTTDEGWLRNIVGHRLDVFDDEKQNDKYDVIAGKIANDNTNATLLAYMNGLYGAVGTEAAEKICISLLLPERLSNQYCFRTERAVRCLKYAESEQIWL